MSMAIANAVTLISTQTKTQQHASNTNTVISLCANHAAREEHYRALGDKAAAEAEEIEAQRHMEEGP